MHRHSSCLPTLLLALLAASFSSGSIVHYTNTSHSTFCLHPTASAQSIYRPVLAMNLSSNYTAIFVNISAKPDSGLVPLKISFTSNVSGGIPKYAYQWDFGDGGSSSEANTTHIYWNSGPYIASLVVSDSENSRGGASTLVYPFNPLQAFPAAKADWGTLPLNVSFTAASFGGIPPYSYFWGFGDGTNSTEENPFHVYRAEGKFIVKLNVTDAEGRSVTQNLPIIVNRSPPGYLGIASWMSYLILSGGVTVVVGAILWRLRVSKASAIKGSEFEKTDP